MSAALLTEPAEHVEAIDEATFATVMASLPSGVVIVTTRDTDGTPRGFTATSVCSVSADPPSVVLCIDLGSRTLPALRRTGRFVLNVMRAGRDELGRRFAAKDDDKFGDVVWCETPRGLPVLAADALAWAECATVGEVEAGDHVLLLARVQRGTASEGLPLVYFRRRFGSWIEEAQTPPASIQATACPSAATLAPNIGF